MYVALNHFLLTLLKNPTLYQLSQKMSVSGSDHGSEIAGDDDQGTMKTPTTSRVWNRGSKMTPRKRAAQFSAGVHWIMCLLCAIHPSDMEVRGDAMWCSTCHVPVRWEEKTFASSHLKSG